MWCWLIVTGCINQAVEQNEEFILLVLCDTQILDTINFSPEKDFIVWDEGQIYFHDLQMNLKYKQY